ncbi:hypothetical protein CN327_25480 [Bacillus cereus]|nr:hypothetical protein CN327_25480 [Bacillus cereus]
MSYIAINDNWRITVNEINNEIVEVAVQCNMGEWANDYSILPDVLEVKAQELSQTLETLKTEVTRLIDSLY